MQAGERSARCLVRRGGPPHVFGRDAVLVSVPGAVPISVAAGGLIRQLDVPAVGVGIRRVVVATVVWVVLGLTRIEVVEYAADDLAVDLLHLLARVRGA